MKKINFRKCIITKKSLPKEDLLRVSKSKDGNITLDLTQNLPGRGAYISKDIEVIKIAAKKKVLDKVFKVSVSPLIYEEMIAAIERR